MRCPNLKGNNDTSIFDFSTKRQATEPYKLVTNGKSDEKLNEKGFLEIKLICSLNRLFEFFYIF